MTPSLFWMDGAAISPLLILFAAALAQLISESIGDRFAKKASFLVALIAIIAAIAAAAYAPESTNPLFTSWLRFDALARFFTILFLSIGLGTTLLASAFFQRFEASKGEYYFLLLTSLFGLLLIGSAANFLTLFLGLETLSISLYIWCGYMRNWQISHEAAVKYFLTGALATSFFLYGVALIYGAVGHTRLDGLLNAYQTLLIASNHTLFLAGAAFVTAGLSFKAAVVPFHVWAPDVYAGASTPVTAFMSVGTKAGAFAAFALVFLLALPRFDPLWSQGMALLACATLIYANFVALRQKQLRRFFAYSGISHAGFLLIPLIAGTQDALTALTFYLVIYALATIGAFAVLLFIDNKEEGVMVQDLYGLFHRSPLLAAILSLCILTLAGIPPTAGFFAKFYVFKVAFEAGYYILVLVGLLTAILAAYYYLRIIAIMFSESPQGEPIPIIAWAATTVAFVSFAALIILSCYPAPLLNLWREAG